MGLILFLAAAILAGMTLWWGMQPDHRPVSSRLVVAVRPSDEDGVGDDEPPEVMSREAVRAAWGASLAGVALLVVWGQLLAAAAWPLLVWLVWTTVEQNRRSVWAERLDDQMLLAVRQLRQFFAQGEGIVDALRRLDREETGEPLRSEIARLRRRMMGEPPADVLGHAATGKRYRETVVMRGVLRHMAVGLQEYLTPAQMAEMLGRYLAVVETAVEIQRELSVEMAAPKITRWIVSALPFVVVALFRWLAPEFQAHLLGELPGQITLGVAFLLVLTVHMIGRRLERLPTLEI